MSMNKKKSSTKIREFDLRLNCVGVKRSTLFFKKNAPLCKIVCLFSLSQTISLDLNI